MSTYFDNPTYFDYLLKHCTGDIPADAEGRIAGARQLMFFLERLNLKREHAVLEVGCGTGRILSVLASRYGVEPYGVDPCHDAIDYLHKQRPDWAERTWYVPDGNLTGLKSQFFDRVVFWGVFELTDQARTLIEISRATKPGARILLNGVRNTEYLEDDVEMNEAVAAYREKKIPIKLSRIDRLEALMSFLGYTIEERFIFKRKADVAADKFEADGKSRRFAEATYILTKSNLSPADLEVSGTTY